MDVFYQEMSYRQIKQQKAFEFISLLSEVGGFLGLLLGASVLTVCELVDYLVLKTVRKCRGRRLTAPVSFSYMSPDPMKKEKSFVDSIMQT